MYGWDDLRDLGLFGFEGALEEARRIFAPGGEDVELLEIGDPRRLTYDTALIGAAGVALAFDTTARLGNNAELPLRVGDQAWDLSFIKVDCSGLYFHEVRGPDELELSDVVPFTGDVAKLRSLDVTRVADLIDDFDGVFDRLAHAYLDGWWPGSAVIVHTGRLHLEATVWLAQLWRSVDPGQIRARLDAFVVAHARDLGVVPLAPA